MTPQDYCKKIVKKSRSNFAASFFFLSKEQRRAMNAFYAFSRVIDDIVDEPGAVAHKGENLRFWEETLNRLEGSIHPIAQELNWAIHHFSIPPHYLRELLEGVASDMQPSHYHNLEELENYCYGVASTVGLVCLYIFGIEESDRAHEAAIAMGKAFQLTNIIRDIAEDADRDRFYLPRDMMTRYGVTEEMIRYGELTGPMAELIADLVDQAENYYQRSLVLFDRDERQKMKPIMVMEALYHDLLRQIRATHYDIFGPRIRLSKWRKMWLIGRVVLNV